MPQACAYNLVSLLSIKSTTQKLARIPFTDVTGFHALLSDETKLKTLYVLGQYKQLSVCDIARMIDVSVSAVSHQLYKLKQAQLIQCQKSGRLVLYSLKDRGILKKLGI